MTGRAMRLIVLLGCFFILSVKTTLAQDMCEGDFDCDGDCDGSDSSVFKADFGRSSMKNPCPACQNTSCPSELIACDGMCIDTATDENNCGECGNYCQSDEMCVAGKCKPCSLHYPAPVPMTGQLVSYGTGDDGDLQEGVGWPIPRFTDNGDGTIIDNLTGLIWLKDANCFGAKTWDESLPIANGLANGSCGLTDGSEVGDWRLPNRKELFSLVHDGYYNPCIPNTIGTGKWSPYDPFINVMSNYYWTSNVLNSNDIYAWSIHMYNGLVGDDLKSRNCYIWPVRNGNMHPSTTTTIPAPVPKSWMTISYSTGDDGYYQTGLGWETPRFTDNSNGTVNDNFTGLMWLQDIGQFGRITWEAAVDTCYNLDYAGYQDWRLPNVKELFSLTDYSQKRPRLPAGHPFTGYEGGHDWCWSSTTEFDSTANADVFSVGAGDVGAENKTTKLFKCWCVRGGQ